MIQRITLAGFQSHVNSVLELSPGLNIIVGPTDSGKTAILRGLRWLVLGEPSGDSFVNKAVGKALVRVSTDKQEFITKLREGKKTTYILGGTIYEKAEIPPEIAAVTGITATDFADFSTVLNFAYQLDAPFLLSEPASAGAKVLGKISGTEKVDGALKAATKEAFAIRTQVSQCEKEQARIALTLQDYTEVERMENEVCAVFHKLEQLEQVQQRRNLLNGIYKRYTEVRFQQAGAHAKKNRLQDVPQLEGTMNRLTETVPRIAALVRLKQRFLQATTEKTDATKRFMQSKDAPELDSRLSEVAFLLPKKFLLETAVQNLSKKFSAQKQAAELLARIPDTEIMLSVLSQVKVMLDLHSNLTTLEWKHKISTSGRAAVKAKGEESAKTLQQTEQELAQLWQELGTCPWCESKLG